MVNAIYSILNEMSEILDMQQLQRLQETLVEYLAEGKAQREYPMENTEYLDMFIAAKKIEGCSERTLSYYKVTIENMFRNNNICNANNNRNVKGIFSKISSKRKMWKGDNR